MARLAQQYRNGALALEIRPWVPVSTESDAYIYFDNGFTRAESLVWVEINFSMGGAPLYFAHHLWDPTAMQFFSFMHFWIEEYRAGDGFVRIEQDQVKADSSYQFHFQVLLAPIYTHQGDSSNFEITLSDVSGADVCAFYADLQSETEQIQKGYRPDPDSVPRQFAALPFGKMLNACAYDAIGERYHTDYLQSEFYRAPFENWLARLPAGAQVLDVGCGYGEPITRAIAERGYRVTGIDLAPKMIELARTRVPVATFENLAVQDLAARVSFDGVCAFNSLLHLDPIELRIALKRIYDALKPQGYFLIVSATPSAGGYIAPYGEFMDQTVWQSQCGLKAMCDAVQEHDLFAVVSTGEERKPNEPETPPPAPPLASDDPLPASHWEEMRQSITEGMRVQGSEEPEQAASSIVEFLQAGLGSLSRQLEEDNVPSVYTLLVQKK
jgi:SAM-dependent methyltransferase